MPVPTLLTGRFPGKILPARSTAQPARSPGFHCLLPQSFLSAMAPLPQCALRRKRNPAAGIMLLIPACDLPLPVIFFNKKPRHASLQNPLPWPFDLHFTLFNGNAIFSDYLPQRLHLFFRRHMGMKLRLFIFQLVPFSLSQFMIGKKVYFLAGGIFWDRNSPIAFMFSGWSLYPGITGVLAMTGI